MAETETKRVGRRWALNFVSGAFAIALALLFVLVLRSIAVQITPPPSPQMEAYPDISTQERCDEEGGRWINRTDETAKPVAARPISIEAVQPYCQGPLAFERERDLQAEKSQQTSLFVFAIGGALAVAASLLERRLQPVAPGLMIGGIVSFFIAGIHIWTLTPGLGRLITIVVIFLFLIGIGLHVFREKTAGSSSKG